LVWKVFFSTLGLIFFAELGDKTQLTTMLLAAQTKRPVPVFLGAAIALAISAFLGVAFGEAVTRIIPQRAIHVASGVVFMVIGALLVSGKL
jgi:putative Ca2+/H+ antiporter (TMEM165/GDT1 family)